MTHAFWLTTLVPGFAIVQRWFPGDLRRGLLATVAWSYVLTVAVMAPIVAIAFTLHFSVRTVGSLYGLLVLAGAVAIVRSGGLRRVVVLVRSTHWFEVGLVLAAIAVTGPLGGSATDDSFTHAAKIRYMRDVGFYLQDPYSPLAVIETRWHVNVQHALYAVASWAGGGEPLELYFRSAWFARLTGIGAIGFLAAVLFRSRWVGAVAMLGVLVFLGTKKAVLYPFSMTAFTVFPILLALMIGVLERRERGRYARVLLCSLSLAALHVGTWFLAGLALGPTFLAWTAWHVPVREWWRRVAPAAGALATGVPFLLVSALQPNHVDAQQGDQHLWMVRTIDLGGWTFTIIDPTHYSWMLPTLAALGLLIALGRPRRSRLMVVAGTAATAMAFMFTPGLLDVLSGVIPYWLAWRFRFMVEVIGFVTIAGGLAWLARPMLRTRIARMALSLTVLCGGLAVFRQDIYDYAVDRSRHRQSLQNARDVQDAVRSVIPPHALIAADPGWSLVLPAVHLVRVMAQDLHHANPADGGLLERYADARELLAPDTDSRRRREIVAKHGVDFIVVHEPAAPADQNRFDDVGDLVSSQHGFHVVRIRH